MPELPDGAPEGPDRAEIRRMTRRRVRVVNSVLALVGLVVLFGPALLAPAEKPVGPGTVALTLDWESDGGLTADIRYATADGSTGTIADVLAPALFPPGTPIAVERNDPGVLQIRSVEPVFALDDTLTLDTTGLVAALGRLDLHQASLTLETPLVDAEVRSDVPPDEQRRGRLTWTTVGADRQPDLEVSLRPSPWSHLIGLALATIAGVLVVVGALLVSERARRTGWRESRVASWFVGLGVLAMIGIGAGFVPATRSDIFVARPLGPLSSFVVPFVPVLLALFALVWCVGGLVACLIRGRAARRWRPPPIEVLSRAG